VSTDATGAHVDLGPDGGLPDRPGGLRDGRASVDRTRRRAGDDRDARASAGLAGDGSPHPAGYGTAIFAGEAHDSAIPGRDAASGRDVALGGRRADVARRHGVACSVGFSAFAGMRAQERVMLSRNPRNMTQVLYSAGLMSLEQYGDSLLPGLPATGDGPSGGVLAE
jgi:hypothetical protein